MSRLLPLLTEDEKSVLCEVTMLFGTGRMIALSFLKPHQTSVLESLSDKGYIKLTKNNFIAIGEHDLGLLVNHSAPRILIFENYAVVTNYASVFKSVRR